MNRTLYIHPEAEEATNLTPISSLLMAQPSTMDTITPEEGWLLQREKLLAWLRVAFAIVAIVVVQLNPTRVATFPFLSIFSLNAFVLYSLIVAYLVRQKKSYSEPLGLATTCLDLLWISLIVFSTGGSRTPFFVYYFFPIITASARWGVRGSIPVALVGVIVYGIIRFDLLVESLNPLAIDTYIVRSIYLTALAYIFGYVSEFEKKQNHRLLALSKTAVEAAATEERRRITYELHDGILQSLATIILRLEACRSRLLESQKELVGDIQSVEDFTRHSMSEIRDFLAGKETQPLAAGTLFEKLRDELSFLHKGLGLKVIFESEPEEPDLPQGIEREVYYVLREALTNVIRHSHASQAEIYMKRTPKVFESSLKDNGVGFDQSSGNNRTGLGLAGMEERIKKIGGQLIIKSSPGMGTSIFFALPLMGKDGSN
ncbi:MAG: hypothetical protein GEU77_06530 [Deltaproteobacteria bacterium]|nr:hypothetical protein [Deltaproteobacteria bacterium]